jgi:hypothetical protein
MIKFISHEYYPEDQYVKESCTLTIDDQQRFVYLRKAKKDGGLFWSPISMAVTQNGQKKFLQAIEWGSNFLQKDILEFLNNRSWERPQTQTVPQYQQQSFPDFGEPPF